MGRADYGASAPIASAIGVSPDTTSKARPTAERGGQDRGERGGDVGPRDLPAIQVRTGADAARARLVGQAAGPRRP